MIKLVATDIDGTILPYTGEFTQGVKSCIKELKYNGIKVVIVTGRMHKGAKKIAERLGLNTPIVSYNGGYIKDEQENVLYERYLPEKYVNEIIDWAGRNNVHLNLYSEDTLYSENDNEEIQRYAKYQQLDYIIKDFSKIKKDKIHKLLAIDYHNPERVDSWLDEMTKKLPDLYIIKSTPYFCEFSTKDATKYCAVKFLQNYWGLKNEEILTIGDQDNDIELLKAGGIKICMENGTDGLKSCADYITNSVDNDGFVKAMKKFVLN